MKYAFALCLFSMIAHFAQADMDCEFAYTKTSRFEFTAAFTPDGRIAGNIAMHFTDDNGFSSFGTFPAVSSIIAPGQFVNFSSVGDDGFDFSVDASYEPTTRRYRGFLRTTDHETQRPISLAGSCSL